MRSKEACDRLLEGVMDNKGDRGVRVGSQSLGQKVVGHLLAHSAETDEADRFASIVRGAFAKRVLEHESG